MGTHHAYLTAAHSVLDQRLGGFRRNAASMVGWVDAIGDLNGLIRIRRAFVGAASDRGTAGPV
jgi:hypothetical protein